MPRADTRGAVADSVLALLTEDGRLTYDAVATHAGVSRQTVYTHFPTRADLLLAAVERARQSAGVDTAVDRVYEAPTALDALEALVAIQAWFVPSHLRAHVAVERERSMDPEVDAAFTARASGRRQLARHVATRLQAEGHLAPPWTVATCSALIEALTGAALTAQLVQGAGWSEDDLRRRLVLTLRRTLTTDPTTHPTTDQKPETS